MSASEWERTFETMLRAWRPSMAEDRRKKELYRVAVANSDTPLPPCPHGKRFVSDCRDCYNVREKELDALDPTRRLKRLAWSKASKARKKRGTR